MDSIKEVVWEEGIFGEKVTPQPAGDFSVTDLN